MPDPQLEIRALHGSIRTLKELLEHTRGLLKGQTARAEAAEANVLLRAAAYEEKMRECRSLEIENERLMALVILPIGA